MGCPEGYSDSAESQVSSEQRQYPPLPHGRGSVSGGSRDREGAVVSALTALFVRGSVLGDTGSIFIDLGVNGLPVMERSVLMLVLRAQDQRITEDVNPVYDESREHRSTRCHELYVRA